MARGVTALVLVFTLLAHGSARAADYDFSVSPDPPVAGQPATFSVVPDPPPDAQVAWDFDTIGDFEESGATVTHTFPDWGDVTVRMRVTEADDKKTTVSRTFTVNAAPAVDFSFAPLMPVVGQDVVFTPAVSDPDGDATTLTWAFGDGATSTETSPSYAYAATGTYSVLLTAMDAHGSSSFAQRDVVVSEAAQEPPPPGDPPPGDPGPGDPGPGGPSAPPADSATPPGGGAVAPTTTAPATTPTTTKTPGPARMRPFPVVRIAGIVLDRGALVQILSVRAPRGAQVLARCRGRGCPARSVVRAAAAARVRTVRLRRFERRLPAGVVLELFVRQAGKVGKYTRFQIRAGKPPARVDRCLMPGRARPVRCS